MKHLPHLSIAAALCILCCLHLILPQAEAGWYVLDPCYYKRWRKFPKRFDWFYLWRWNHESLIDFNLVPQPKVICGDLKPFGPFEPPHHPIKPVLLEPKPVGGYGHHG